MCSPNRYFTTHSEDQSYGIGFRALVFLNVPGSISRTRCGEMSWGEVFIASFVGVVPVME